VPSCLRQASSVFFRKFSREFSQFLLISPLRRFYLPRRSVLGGLDAFKDFSVGAIAIHRILNSLVSCETLSSRDAFCFVGGVYPRFAFSLRPWLDLVSSLTPTGHSGPKLRGFSPRRPLVISRWECIQLVAGTSSLWLEAEVSGKTRVFFGDVADHWEGCL